MSVLEPPFTTCNDRRQTYTKVASWLEDARKNTNPNTVILLIGNKVDMEKDREVSFEEAKKFADENGSFIFCMFEMTLSFFRTAFPRNLSKNRGEC